MLKKKIIRLSTLFAITAVIISLIYYGYAPSVSPPANSAKLQEITIQVGERQRHYSLYIPARLDQHAPLVFILHGSMQPNTYQERPIRLFHWTNRRVTLP